MSEKRRMFILIWAIGIFVLFFPLLCGAQTSPKISVKPTSMNFGSVKAGGISTPQVLVLGNTGKANLVVESITLTGEGAPEFQIFPAHGCPDPVPPNGSCSVTVTFRPAVPFGKKGATLLIASNDPKKSTVSVKLSGQVSPPKISLSTTKLDFGSLNIGSTSSAKALTIKNTGTSDLEISSVMVSGPNASEFVEKSNIPDFFPTHPCPSTLTSGSSCSIGMLFSPRSKGTRSASLNIISNDPKTPALNVKLAGKGMETATPPPVLKPPENLRYEIDGKRLTLIWDAVAGASGYRLSIGLQSGNYAATYDIGPLSQVGPLDISGVLFGTYYAVVKAYHSSTESGYSNEIGIVIARPRYSFTEEQQVLLTDAGFPDYFTISFNDDPQRREETWIYKEFESMFTFWDGMYANDEIIFVDPDSYSNPPALDPSFFTKDTTLPDLIALLGSDYVEVDQAVFRPIIGDVDFKIYHYKSKGLFVSFLDGTLAVALTVDIPKNKPSGSVAVQAPAYEGQHGGIDLEAAPDSGKTGAFDATTALLLTSLQTINYAGYNFQLENQAGWEGVQTKCADLMKTQDPSGKKACNDAMMTAIDEAVRSDVSGSPVSNLGLTTLSQAGKVQKEMSEKCILTVSPSSASFGSEAGSGSIEVSGPLDCPWSVVSNVSWITILSSDRRNTTGNVKPLLSYVSTVTYSVTANTSGSPRTGTIAVAGQTVTVTQSATSSCTYTLSPSSASFGSEAGSGSFEVTTQTGCSVMATPNVSWIKVTSGGNASQGGTVKPLLSLVSTVTFTIEANTSGSERTGAIIVAGQAFTVTQSAASSCNYTLSPSSASFNSKAGIGTFEVTTQMGCSVTATPNVTWIKVTSGGGTGNPGRVKPLLSSVSTVSYTVESNTSSTERTGTILVAEQVFTVTQAGEVACNFQYTDCIEPCRANGLCAVNVITPILPEGCVGVPETTKTCTYTPPPCTYTYSGCTGPCQQDGRCPVNMTGYSPSDCTGTPETTQLCPACTDYTYSDSACQPNVPWMGITGLGTKTRTYTGTPLGCAGGITIPSPLNMCCDGFDPC